METIFDHHIKQEEYKRIQHYTPKELSLRFNTQIDAYVDIVYSFQIRGNDKKAKQYREKTKDSMN